MTKRYVVLVMWLAAELSPPVLAQRVGPEFQVNTYTPFEQDDASVGSDEAGNFVVVWESDDQDGSGAGIFGQRYDRSGDRLGGEFQVNTTTSGSQFGTDIALDADGNFVVVWKDDPFGSGQRHDKDGNRLGAEFALSEVPGRSFGQKVTSDATGNFVVVWHMDDVDGSYGVFGQRFDRDGNRLGPTFQVNTFTPGYQWRADVASDASGNFVVVWDSDFGHDGQSYGVFGQRYDNSGNPLGGEFQVNTYTTDKQAYASVASDAAGNFVVVWHSGSPGQQDGQDGAEYGVFGQRYDSSGSRLGSEFQVNTYTLGSQRIPSVTVDPIGNFIVAWTSEVKDGDGWGIFGQRYDSEGSRFGAEFRVNTYTTNDQGGLVDRRPSISADASGNFVVVWESEGQDGGGGRYPFGIFGQRFSGGCRSTVANPTSLCPEKPR